MTEHCYALTFACMLLWISFHVISGSKVMRNGSIWFIVVLVQLHPVWKEYRAVEAVTIQRRVYICISNSQRISQRKYTLQRHVKARLDSCQTLFGLTYCKNSSESRFYSRVFTNAIIILWHTCAMDLLKGSRLEINRPIEYGSPDRIMF